MSDEQVKTQEAQDQAETPEVQDTVETTEIVGVSTDTFRCRGTTVKKGKGKGRVAFFYEPNEGESLRSFHDRIRLVVGEENYDKCVQAEVIRKACNDATVQALQTAEDGKVSDVALSKAFCEWYLPSTRRSGVHIKDLREKAQEIFGELNPLLIRHFQHKPGEEGSLSEEEHNKMLQLTLEYSDLNTKIEEKSRKGKTAKK